MDGIINVLKPVGMTSADVVRWISRRTGVKKAGHIGTLDPGAAGVLPVCIGKATRLAQYHADREKWYRAEITLGVTTDTFDAFGTETSRTLPRLARNDLLAVLPRFTGTIEQVPPMYSAVRKNGKHLYEYARQGREVERENRQVTIEKLDLIDWQDDAYPKALLDVVCSKGTYIRTLCHDIGAALGCGAHMSFLLRLKAGSFDLASALTLEEIDGFLNDHDLSFLIPPEWGIAMPRVSIAPSRLEAFRNGLPTGISMLTTAGVAEEDLPLNGGQVQVYCQGRFIGIGAIRQESLCPKKSLSDSKMPPRVKSGNWR